MRLRHAALCGLAIVLASTSVAGAAAKAKPKPPKPLCNLLTDDKDDGDWNLVGAVKSPMLDIQSGDISTSKNQLVAVLRLGSTNPAGDNWTQLGYSWAFGATANGVDYSFSARRPSSGTWTSGASIGNSGVTYKFTIEGNALVWRVPRKGIKELTKPRLTWVDFRGNSNAFSSTADTAFTKASKYPDLHPSCVKS